jgi:hypothetical protein
MTSALERLYAEFLEATDRSARAVSDEYKAHVLRLENDICIHLASQGGTVTIGRIQWVLVEVLIGRDRLAYFKTLIAHDRVEGAGGFSFERHQSDVDIVLPVSAQMPTLGRRKMLRPLSRSEIGLQSL